MKIICLEEHVTTAPIVDAWAGRALRYAQGSVGEKLAEMAEPRLADMDDAGVDVQMLSLPAPGLEPFPAAESVALARDANDQIAEAVAAHPDRLQGFVNLPTPDPEGAAAELRRGIETLGFSAGIINGRVGAQNIDHPDFEPLWATAEALKAPIYIHPSEPPEAVQEAYYSDIGDEAAAWMFATGAIGWHYEVGIQLLRLIYGRVLDRHPALRIIVGHWGEVVLFYAERLQLLDRAMRPALERSLMEYLRENVYFTPSGMFSERYLTWTKDLVGIDRLMFSTDYPFIPSGAGAAREFLSGSNALDDDDREKLAHGTWETLTAERSHAA